jgi:glyoxylase-like metal-dependent hydrolase (beta-lactamase superfamily II)
MFALLFIAGTLWAQQGLPLQSRTFPIAAAEGTGVHLIHVQGNVYMIAGAGPNLTLQVGDDYMILVDSGTPGKSAAILAAMRTVSNRRVQYLINTSADPTHTGNNTEIKQSGFFAQQGGTMDRTNTGAAILAHLGVLDRMSAPAGSSTSAPESSWPIDTYSASEWKLFNDEPVILMHAPAAHTDGDTFVFFRRSDVISTGDLFTPDLYPVIRSDMGGSINGLIAALNRIIDLMVTKVNEEGGTFLIPGHGRICERSDIVNYRDAVTIIRDRIQDMINHGMTLEQVKSARPTLDYDAEYGADSGPWTTAMFIEAVYHDLIGSKSAREVSASTGDHP